MHAAGVLPAREERKKSDKVQILLFAVWEQITQKIPGNNEIKRYLGNENYRRLYWRDPTVNCSPKEKPPGSPRTFSTVPYPRTSSLRAKQDRPCPFPFSILPSSLLCFKSKAKLKWFVCLLYLLDERERTFVSGFMDWIQSASRHNKKERVMVTGERFQRRPSRVSGCFLD